MKQFLFDGEFEEFSAFSGDMKNAIEEVENLFAHAEMIQPAEGFVDRFQMKLALQKKKEYRRQIIGLLGFNILFIVMIAGFLFMNWQIELPSLMAGLEVFFEQFFVLFDSFVKLRVVLSTFADIIPVTIVLGVGMFFSFGFWLFLLMVRQFLGRSALNERV